MDYEKLYNEDDRIREEIIAFIKKRDRSGCDYDYDKWIAWLEKQSEQKVSYTTTVETGDGGINALVTRDIEIPFGAKDSELFEESITIPDGCYAHIDDDKVIIKRRGKSALEAIKEEKVDNTNKIEPKFHEGEWITNGDYTWKIVEVKPLDYILQSQDGNIVDDTISHVDEQFHSFTIQDAKDGDVLADKYNNIGIFQECKGICWHSYIYLGCDGELRGFNIGGSHEQTGTHPAIKEQREQLEKAMADAGYEWDAEKKELKKI